MLSWFLGSPGYFLINSYSKMKENDLLAHRPICRLFLINSYSKMKESIPKAYDSFIPRAYNASPKGYNIIPSASNIIPSAYNITPKAYSII